MKVKAQVQYRKLSELKELEGNPRIIKKDQFEKLKQSLKDNADYFEARPIILSDRTGELVILAGNQRYKAAKAIGMQEVPTVLLEGLSEAREQEIIIRDNVENGEWDMDILANEWNADVLESWGVDAVKNFADMYDTNFALDDGEKSPFATMTFTLTGEQVEEIESALKMVGDVGEYFGNTNKNGNKIYEIVKQWAEQKKFK